MMLCPSAIALLAARAQLLDAGACRPSPPAAHVVTASAA